MFPFNWGKLVSMLVCISTEELIGGFYFYYKITKLPKYTLEIKKTF